MAVDEASRLDHDTSLRIVFERPRVEFARGLEGGVDKRLRNTVAGHVEEAHLRRS